MVDKRECEECQKDRPTTNASAAGEWATGHGIVLNSVGTEIEVVEAAAADGGHHRQGGGGRDRGHETGRGAVAAVPGTGGGAADPGSVAGVEVVQTTGAGGADPGTASHAVAAETGRATPEIAKTVDLAASPGLDLNQHEDQGPSLHVAQSPSPLAGLSPSPPAVQNPSPSPLVGRDLHPSQRVVHEAPHVLNKVRQMETRPIMTRRQSLKVETMKMATTDVPAATWTRI